MNPQDLQSIAIQNKMSENADMSRSSNQLASNILLNRKKKDDSHFDQVVQPGIQTSKELQNLLASDFVLGNQTDAETSEFKWMVKLQELEYFCIHPQVESCVQGAYRSFLLDDKTEKVSSLTSSEKIQIKQAILASVSRSSRSRDGWQQEMNASVFAVSERRNVSDPQPQRRSLFGRFR